MVISCRACAVRWLTSRSRTCTPPRSTIQQTTNPQNHGEIRRTSKKEVKSRGRKKRIQDKELIAALRDVSGLVNRATTSCSFPSCAAESDPCSFLPLKFQNAPRSRLPYRVLGLLAPGPPWLI